MDFTIEPLTALDEPTLERLYGLSLQYFDEYARLDRTREVAELRDEHVRNYFTVFLDRQDRHAFVAKLDGRIIAYATCLEKGQACFYKVETIGDISGLFVEAPYRRQGVGSALLASAVEFLRLRRVKHFAASTAVGNEAALGLCAKAGMRRHKATMLGEIG